MNNDYYCPRIDSLKPYFGIKSRIDSRKKAFAFILGILIGSLLNSRSHHGNQAKSVRFSTSQLLSLTGDDLAGLYDKVMGELDAVSGNICDDVAEVMVEARHLHASLAGRVELDKDDTTYFILYGISVSSSICSHPDRGARWY